MENKTESQPTKAGRYRYFQMLIHLGLRGPKTKINLWIDSLPLIQVLKANQFVSQLVLEITLDQLRIEDHGRLISLSNFSGQLQRDDPSGVPFWNVSLETRSLTTGRSIARVVSKKLFDTPTRIDPSIEISTKTSFQRMEREKRLSLPDSDWYPGYFSQTTVRAASLLKTEEVRESIQDTPEKFSILIQSLVKESLNH